MHPQPAVGGLGAAPHWPGQQDVGAAADRVIFTGTGALSVATGWDFSICRPTFAPGNAESRRVIVTATGTIRSRRDTTGAPAGACA